MTRRAAGRGRRAATRPDRTRGPRRPWGPSRRRASAPTRRAGRCPRPGPISRNLRSSRCGPNSDRPRLDLAGPAPAEFVQERGLVVAHGLDLRCEPEREALACRRQRSRPRGEPRREFVDQVAAAAAQLRRDPRELRVPRVERGRIGAVLDGRRAARCAAAARPAASRAAAAYCGSSAAAKASR